MARDLRGRYRDAEREASRLRLLQDACVAMADERAPRAALHTALVHVVRFLACDAGVVLGQDTGAFAVQATSGAALPVGARVPVAAALGAALKMPLQVRERVMTPLRVGARSVALEVLVSLRVNGEPVGLLAVSSARAVAKPDAADLATLQALATVLGLAVDRRPAPRAARAARRDAAAAITRLTPREQQVLALLPRGASNAEIAEMLGIATGTVKVHVEHILHKLGLGDRTQAAVRAAEWGLGT